MTITIIFFLTSFFSLLIALFVYMQNRKKRLNQSFLLFIFFINLWLFSVYFLNNFPVYNLAAFRIALVLAVLMAFSMLYFVTLVTKSYFKNWLWKVLLLSAAVFGIISASPLAISSVEVSETPRGLQLIPDREFGYVLVLMFIVFCSMYALWLLLKKYLRAQGSTKVQLQLVLISLGLATVIALTTNALLPNITKNTDFTMYAPFSVLILSIGLSYAIIKHRFLDIRLIVARSVAYTLLLISLSFLYGLGLFVISSIFLESSALTLPIQLIYTVLAVFLAFTFQPFKRFFDKITNKIFYQDAYDSQTVLKQVGEVLASEIDLDAILNQTLEVLQDSLKFTQGRFLVVSERKIYKQVTIGKTLSEYPEITKLAELEGDVVITDELEGDKRQLLLDYNIAAMLKLKTQYVAEGYLLLGVKRSGSIYTDQDIQLLNTVSNELAVGIQNAKAYEEIQQFNITLQKRIEAATKELRENNEKLKELDQAKDEFISMASHQLRTPLTTIKGYLSMMLEGDAGKLSKKQQEFVNLAFVRSQRMVYLISDMLNVSRISTGKLTFDKKEFDLVDVVESEVDQLRRQAEIHEVRLTLHPSEEKNILITLDEGKIRQVVMNFIDNAIYYAPKGKVDVYLEKKNNFVEFRVVDDGIGVSEDDQEQLFTKFFRAENARHVRPDGTGLGLYMAKQVIEAQNGEIIFKSEKEKGSTFGFRFSLEE